MKAVICTKYGPPEVLQLQEVENPVPENNEVLIRIHAASVTTGDSEMRRFKMPAYLWLLARLGLGLRGPRMKILGQEFSGEIESVGKDVTKFRIGDQVFAFAGFNLGAYAGYKCMPEDGVLAEKPENITYEEVAVIPMGGLIALNYLRKANIQKGQEVLINGASGSIGTIAVQLAKYYGAEVTGVCSSRNLEMVNSIGADHVVDYTREDFTKSGEKYNVIFDVIGKSPVLSSLRSLEENGIYLFANPGLSHMILGPFISMTGKKVVTRIPEEKAEDLTFLKGLMEDGKIKAVMDRFYPLEQIVDAHRYVDKGHKMGNVVLTLK